MPTKPYILMRIRSAPATPNIMFLSISAIVLYPVRSIYDCKYAALPPPADKRRNPSSDASVEPDPRISNAPGVVVVAGLMDVLVRFPVIRIADVAFLICNNALGTVVPMPTPFVAIRPIVDVYIFSAPVPVVAPPWEMMRVE